MSDHHEAPLASTHLEDDDEVVVVVPKAGFLPIETNWFDRLFISIVIWIALSLFWFRFMEPAGFSIWISNAIAIVLAFITIRKG